MFVMRLTFTQFAISIACKMTSEQLMITHKNQWKTCKHGAYKCQFKMELYRTCLICEKIWLGK